MSIVIELAQPARAPECARVARIARQQALPDLPVLHTTEEDEDFFANRVFHTDTVWVALEGNAVIGFIAFSEGWVNHLHVLPDFQRLGIGARLLQKAKEEGTDLDVWTFERNPDAIRFYEREGFSVVKRADGAENEEREPDVLLRWRVRN